MYHSCFGGLHKSKHAKMNNSVRWALVTCTHTALLLDGLFAGVSSAKIQLLLTSSVH